MILDFNRIALIPVIHQPRGDRLYFSVNDTELEAFRTQDGFWHWRTHGLAWHDLGFMDSKPRRFETAAAAQQDAMNEMIIE